MKHRSILISGDTAEVLGGHAGAKQVAEINNNPARLGLVRLVLADSEPSDVISSEAAAIAVSDTGERGVAYVTFFERLGINPGPLAA